MSCTRTVQACAVFAHHFHESFRKTHLRNFRHRDETEGKKLMGRYLNFLSRHLPVQGQLSSDYCASTFLSTLPAHRCPGPRCEQLTVAVIMVIMMMMTVTVISISRLHSWGTPGPVFKMTLQCCAAPDTHSFDIMSR